jgi:hypothetical protein
MDRLSVNNRFQLGVSLGRQMGLHEGRRLLKYED